MVAADMTRFRPCIDLHQGKVKQIVGGTLTAGGAGTRTNFTSDSPAAWFAGMYRDDNLTGGHVIMLGPGNEEQAIQALRAWPGGLQVGGGIRPGTAARWIDAGASHVIVTSALFDGAGMFQADALDELVAEVGSGHLVIDLSCRTHDDGWVVAMDQWRLRTELAVTPATLAMLAPYCAEFLIHAADVEGLCHGIDGKLVAMLGAWGKCPITYAGGARGTRDLHLVDELSGGMVDLTIGSALDIFGGSGARYADCVAFNHRHLPA